MVLSATEVHKDHFWFETSVELYSADFLSAYNYTTVFRMRLGDSTKDSVEPEITRTITFIDGQTHFGTVCPHSERKHERFEDFAERARITERNNDRNKSSTITGMQVLSDALIF